MCIRDRGVGDAFGLLSGLFYGLSMFFNGYRKDADTTARGCLLYTSRCV